MDYAVCEIAGRQYIVKPGQTFKVNKLAEDKTMSCDKVILMVDGDKVEIGMPYLKKNLEFDVLGTVKMDKIRVAKYKAKSNYRRVNGQRAEMTELKLK